MLKKDIVAVIPKATRAAAVVPVAMHIDLLSIQSVTVLTPHSHCLRTGGEDWWLSREASNCFFRYPPVLLCEKSKTTEG